MGRHFPGAANAADALPRTYGGLTGGLHNGGESGIPRVEPCGFPRVTRMDSTSVTAGADTHRMSWASLVSVGLLGWLAIALLIGTIVGHGIAFGTGSDFE
jgi:hypothetical protein